MGEEARPNFSLIVSDNKQAAAQALARQDFVQAYLLMHALIEALLRMFLRVPEDGDVKFNKLIQKYRVSGGGALSDPNVHRRANAVQSTS